LAGVCGWSDGASFKYRHLEELAELGIVELPSKGTRIDGAVVRLSGEWRKRLDERREFGGELAAGRQQAAKHARERLAFRDKTVKADDVPPTMGAEEFRRVMEEHAEDEEEARREEQRRKVGMTAEVFVHDTLSKLGKIRLQLLEDVWVGMGGNRWHIWPAIWRLGCKTCRLKEYGNHLFVYPPERC
jgi:hypothetical protein